MIRIINGDCLKVMATMPAESFDCIYADPPYAASRKGEAVTRRLYVNGVARSADLNMDFGEWDHYESKEAHLAFTLAWMTEATRLLKTGGQFYVWWLTDELLYIKQIAEKIGLTWLKPFWFIKANPAPNLNTMSRYVTAIEGGGWMCKGKVSYFKGGAYRLNYVKASIPHGDKRIHTTQKPLEAVSYHLETSLAPGGSVLDPFMGSGTTLLAASQLGADAVGIEQDGEMCNLAAKFIGRNLKEVK